MPEKLSTEGAGSNLTQKTFIAYYSGLRVMKRKADEARAETKALEALYRNECKRGIKELGVEPRAMKLFTSFMEIDSDEVAVTLRKLAEYTRFMNMPWGTQLDIFTQAEAQQTEEDREAAEVVKAEDAGLLCGAAGGSVDDNPHPGGSAAHVAWHKACKNGLEFYERSTKPAGETKRKAAPGKRKPSGNPEDQQEAAA